MEKNILTPEVNKIERNLMLCNYSIIITPKIIGYCRTKSEFTIHKDNLYWVNVGGCSFETWHIFIYDSQVDGNLLAIYSQWDSDYGMRNLEYFHPAFLNTPEWISKVGQTLVCGEDYEMEEDIIRHKGMRKVVDIPKLITKN